MTIHCTIWSRNYTTVQAHCVLCVCFFFLSCSLHFLLLFRCALDWMSRFFHCYSFHCCPFLQFGLMHTFLQLRISGSIEKRQFDVKRIKWFDYAWHNCFGFVYSSCRFCSFLVQIDTPNNWLVTLQIQFSYFSETHLQRRMQHTFYWVQFHHSLFTSVLSHSFSLIYYLHYFSTVYWCAFTRII